MIYLICYYVVPFLAFSLAFIKYLERVLFYRKVYVGCQGFSAKAQKKQYLFNLAMFALVEILGNIQLPSIDLISLF